MPDNRNNIIIKLEAVLNESKLVFSTVAIFLIIALIIVILKPAQYTSTAKVVAVSSDLENNGLSSGINALKNIGINLGSSEEGLSSDVYPNLIKSPEILNLLAKKKFYFIDIDSSLSIENYLKNKSILQYIQDYTIFLPYTIYKGILPQRKTSKINTSDSILYMNTKEWNAIKWLKNIIKVNKDIKTGVITIKVTTFDPILSAKINSSIIKLFKKHIRQFYNKSTNENLKFLRRITSNARKDLMASEQQEIDFISQNSQANTIRLQIELNRIKREISHKSDIYNEIQLQLTQTEIKLRKQEPIIRVIERPYPPLIKSGIRAILLLVLFFIIGILFSFIIIISKWKVMKIEPTEREEIKKLIKNKFHFFNYLHKKI